MNKLIVCNQKMFLSYDEALQLKEDLLSFNNEDFVICPNFINMNIYKDFNVCAQNCFYENSGSFTGEVSPYHLSLLGVKYVLIGHCERREFETEESINKKVKKCLNNFLTPIICIGESYYDNQMHKTSSVLKKQITTALKDVSDSEIPIIVAYEPSWVIGKNKSLTKDEIEDSCLFIKKVLKDLSISNYKILYGGSINENNIAKIQTDLVDGYLIGNACCDINKLKTIIKCINSVNINNK